MKELLSASKWIFIRMLARKVSEYKEQEKTLMSFETDFDLECRQQSAFKENPGRWSRDNYPPGVSISFLSILHQMPA